MGGGFKWDWRIWPGEVPREVSREQILIGFRGHTGDCLWQREAVTCFKLETDMIRLAFNKVDSDV